MMQCSSVVAVGLAFFTLSSLGAELKRTPSPCCRTLTDVYKLNYCDYQFHDMSNYTVHLHDLPNYARTGGTMAGEECIGTLNEVAIFGDAIFRKYKYSYQFAKSITLTKGDTIRIWYHIKKKTGQFCPYFDEKEAEYNRFRRETIMQAALPELKEHFLTRIEITVNELKRRKCELDDLGTTYGDLCAELKGIKCTGRKVRCYFLGCKCESIRSQLDSTKIRREKTYAKFSEIEGDLARRVKKFRKLAAIYDEDWEEDLKRAVTSDRFEFDLGCYIPEQTRTLDNSDKDSETVYGISSDDEEEEEFDPRLMNGCNGAEIRHSASNTENSSDSDSDGSLFSELKDLE